MKLWPDIHIVPFTPIVNYRSTSLSTPLLSSESILSSASSTPVSNSIAINSATNNCNTTMPQDQETLTINSDGDCISSKHLNILYFNARSILPKVNELQLLIGLHKPNIICIVETWLSSEISDQELQIDGYQIVRLDRNRHGGGVMFYISDALHFTVLPACPSLELLSLIIHENSNRCCVSLFYRPPNSPPSILTTLSTLLEAIDISTFSNFILVGDFNVDVSNPSHPLTNTLNDMSHSFHLQ